MRRLPTIGCLATAVLLAFAFVACDDQQTQAPKTVDPGGVLSGKADGTEALANVAEAATLSLAYDNGAWREEVNGLRAGSKLRVYYDVTRLGQLIKWSGCDVLEDVRDDAREVMLRLMQMGYQIEATMHLVYYENGQWLSNDQANLSTNDRVAELEIPYHADQVRVYVSGRLVARTDQIAEPDPDTCKGWDSNLGADFWFDLAPPTEVTGTITFGDNWSETISGKVVAGKSIELVYDETRLQAMLDDGWTSKYSFAIGPWLNALVSVDNRTFLTVKLGNYESGEYGNLHDRWVGVRPVISVPADAEILSIYVEVGSYMGVRGYDSNFGKNYIFNVSR